jgi:hypothetical protein
MQRTEIHVPFIARHECDVLRSISFDTESIRSKAPFIFFIARSNPEGSRVTRMRLYLTRVSSYVLVASGVATTDFSESSKAGSTRSLV